MTQAFTFEDATKAGAKARLALCGPTGAGKTYTALAIATAWGGTIGVIDTERGSASKYAKNPATGKGIFAFKRLNMTHYDPRDLPTALAAAASAGIDTVIIDSLSKFWSGEGGMLQQVDNAAKRSYGGNNFGGWKEARPWEAAMIEAILSYPGHVIVTMRVKTEWVIVENDRGKKQPQRIGLQPEQRANIEYEFDIVGDMDQENNLVISKTRCPDLAGAVINRPGGGVAETILQWLDDGSPTFTASDYRAMALAGDATFADVQQWYKDVQAAGIGGAAVEDQHGDAMTLTQLLVNRGHELKAAEVFTQQGATPEPSAAELQAEAAAARDALESDLVPPDASAPIDEFLDHPENGVTRERPVRPPAPDSTPASGDAQPSQPVADANGKTKVWMAQFAADVQNAKTADQLNALRGRIGQAVMDSVITPEAANDLTGMLTDRIRAARRAA